MREETRHKLLWGWLRLFLGTAQIFFAAAGVIALLRYGPHPLTWTLAACALSAFLASSAIYRGRQDPKLNGDAKKRSEQ